jgi:hypothetical protein
MSAIVAGVVIFVGEVVLVNNAIAYAIMIVICTEEGMV